MIVLVATKNWILVSYEGFEAGNTGITCHESRWAWPCTPSICLQNAKCIGYVDFKESGYLDMCCSTTQNSDATGLDAVDGTYYAKGRWSCFYNLAINSFIKIAYFVPKISKWV